MYDMNSFVVGSLETSGLGIFHTATGNWSLPHGTYNIYFLGKIRNLHSVILGFEGFGNGCSKRRVNHSVYGNGRLDASI